MLGIRYLKVAPTTYVMQYRRGSVVREGAGLSFLYFAPNSVIVRIGQSTSNVPFVFNEVTSDLQEATIQGELTYRVADPKKLSAALDFSTDAYGRYQSDDPHQLNDRLIHAAQTLTRSYAQQRPLRQLLLGSTDLIAHVLPGLQQSDSLLNLGIEITGLVIISIEAAPEMTKALQAEAREELLREADEAVYTRRNAAVEMERQIRENELQTEIAVEQKQREVRETQMQAEIAVEQQRATLVDQRVENEKKESQARAEALRATLEPVRDVDWKKLVSATGGLDSRSLIAMAFHELADNADKIGELNISPELIGGLTRNLRRDRAWSHAKEES